MGESPWLGRRTFSRAHSCGARPSSDRGQHLVFQRALDRSGVGEHRKECRESAGDSRSDARACGALRSCAGNGRRPVNSLDSTAAGAGRARHNRRARAVSAAHFRQSQRHERMNGSKPYGSSGDQQKLAEVPARVTQRASPFPSPPPSPSGRGRILRCLSANPDAVFARRTSRTTEPAADCSLSPWERVRVRGIELSFGTATRPIPEIVELRESRGRAGDFPRQ
jgi:hypothetical protein